MAAPTATAAPRLTQRINRIEISATLAVVNEAERLRAQGVDLVDFGAGEPHFHTPEHIKRAAIEAIENDFTKYTAVAGTDELRDAIVRRHAADLGSNYKREETIATTGGKHALFNAVQVLVEAGDEVIVPVPYWVSFKDIVRFAGAECVYVETDEDRGFTLTPDMVERAITPRTKAIILNSPNNPSGAVMPGVEYAEIVRLAHHHGIYVISDECYVYLNYAGKAFSAGSVAEAREHVVIIGSLSKTYAMTGWRLGYALGPQPIIKAMQKLQSQQTSNASSIVQKAAVGALNGPQDCVEKMRTEYIGLRDLMVSGLRAIDGITCHKPDGAFYVYPNVSGLFGRAGIATAAEVSARLLREAGVVTVPGEGFGTKEHVRFSYATSPKMIEKGLERVRKFVAGL